MWRRMKSMSIPVIQRRNMSNSLLINVISTEFDGILNEIDTEYSHTLAVNKNALKASNRALYSIHCGVTDSNTNQFNSVHESVQELLEVLTQHEHARERFDRLSFGIESLCSVKIFHHFLSHGSLPLKSQLQICDDEEYIGSVLTFGQELAKYCSDSALQGDGQTVLFCQSFINALNGILLEFFFRNGPLRRKFDSLKYTVKKIDSIVFDLSMLTNPTTEQAPPSVLGKRSLDEDSPTSTTATTTTTGEGSTLTTLPIANHQFYDSNDFNEIKKRMNDYDQKRETVIKKTRDIQKLSKQAIYSLHGKRFKEAKDKLDNSKIIAKEIHAILLEAHSLRAGAFSNSLEEWIEAALFQEWLTNQQILTRQQIENELNQPITISEYIGGLSDLTGELGRLAVVFGTSRDISSLQSVNEVCNSILLSIQDITLSTGKYSMKTTNTRQNVTKIEGLVYEVTMVLKGSIRQTRPLDDVEENEGVKRGGGGRSNNSNANNNSTNNADDEEI